MQPKLEQYFEPSGSLPLANPKHKGLAIFMNMIFALMIGGLIGLMPHSLRGALFVSPLILGCLFFGVVIWGEYDFLAPYRLEWNPQSFTILRNASSQSARWKDVVAVKIVRPYNGLNIRLKLSFRLADGGEIQFPLPFSFPIRSVIVHYLGDLIPANTWPTRR